MSAMRKAAGLLGLSLALVAGSAWAQEPAEESDERRPEPTHKIRVLENPYDISSFYRSSQEGAYPFFGAAPEGQEHSSRYPIAGYYRSRQSANPYGYSRFWTSGYSGRDRGGIFLGYRRRIGENGDLLLFAPFLAPVGPLTGVFVVDGNR